MKSYDELNVKMEAIQQQLVVGKQNTSGLREVPWETRNLGLPAFELERAFLLSWAQRSLKSELAAQVAGDFFVQLRLPANYPKLTSMAECLGFRNAELTLSPFIDLSRTKVYQQYIVDWASFIPSGVDGKLISFDVCGVTSLEKNTCSEIVRGAIESFRADRFHTDPHCSPVIADLRIGMWLEKDIFTDPEVNCSTVLLADELVGFIVWKKSEFILGGLIPKFIGKGLAKLLYLQTMKDIHCQSDFITTTISANNIEVLNLYSRLEFSFRNPTQVFHLWARAFK